MSAWIDKKRQEAFALYGRYIAMGLHMRAGSSYDYTTYGGKTSVSFASFVAKKDLVRNFINLSTGLGVGDIERFVFANMRNQVDLFHVQKRKAVEMHQVWEYKFGTKEKFFNTSLDLIRSYPHNCPMGLELVLDMISSGRDDMIEPIIGILHIGSITPNMVSEAIESNIVWKLYWNRIIQIRKIYYHFGIL